MDFHVAYENGGNLLDQWDRYSTKILHFLSKSSNVKDKQIRAMVDLLLAENASTIPESK